MRLCVAHHVMIPFLHDTIPPTSRKRRSARFIARRDELFARFSDNLWGEIVPDIDARPQAKVLFSLTVRYESITAPIGRPESLRNATKPDAEIFIPGPRPQSSRSTKTAVLTQPLRGRVPPIVGPTAKSDWVQRRRVAVRHKRPRSCGIVRQSVQGYYRPQDSPNGQGSSSRRGRERPQQARKRRCAERKPRR